MSEHPSPTDYQQAVAHEGGAVPYEQAAATAVGAVIDPAAAGGEADAGATIEQIRQQVTREVLLPMETRIEEMMAAARAQQEEMSRKVAQLQAQLTSTQAQVGPPAYQLYAAAVAQRVKSLAAAYPAQDLRGVSAAAARLADVAQDVAAGKADPADLANAAVPVELHFLRIAPHLEGASTVVAELAHLADEAARISA